MIGTRRVTFYHLYSIEYNPASSLRVFIISHMRITGTAAYIARKNRFISVLEIFEQARSRSNLDEVARSKMPPLRNTGPMKA